MRVLGVGLLALILGAGLVAATACGGGGGGTGGLVVADPFNGEYHFVQYTGKAGPPYAAMGAWGDFTSDGTGTVTAGTSWSIENGVLDGPTPGSTVPYTMLPGRRIEWLVSGFPLVEGGVSANGEHAILGSVLTTMDPTIVLLTKPPTGMGLGSLVGNYHYAQLITSPTGTTDATYWGLANFDGAGSVDLVLYGNIDGSLIGPAATTESYLVAPDGTVGLSLGTQRFGGVLRQDGQVAWLGGSVTGGGVTTIGVLIKYSSGATLGTFSGDYHIAGMSVSDDVAPPINWQSLTGTIDSSGTGQFRMTSLTTLSDNGTVNTASSPGTPTPYTVAPNGGMTIPGANLVGAVASDGSVAAVVGGTAAGSPHILWVMIR